MYSMTSHLPLKSIRFFLHVLAKFAVNERDEFGHAFWFYLKKSLNSKLWGELDFSDKKCERGEE